MKDGTIYPNLYRGPGSSGYESESSSRFKNVFAIDRILEPSQVESLLFAKRPEEISGDSPEGMYYIVPLGQN